jgi:exodeoxyribonuclease VII large subunit
MALLEERKKNLAAEGLFDESRKRRLPFIPRVIGLVTSPTGAVVRDMLHGFNERFPVCVVLWPVRVRRAPPRFLLRSRASTHSAPMDLFLARIC